MTRLERVTKALLTATAAGGIDVEAPAGMRVA
jgi:hypothetical protein